ISASDDDTIRVWRVSNGELAGQVKLDSDIKAVQISPDGSVIAALAYRNVFFLDRGLNRMGNMASPGYSDKLWIGPGGHRAITMPDGRPVAAWDVDARRRIDAALSEDGGSIVSVSESPDRRWIA